MAHTITLRKETADDWDAIAAVTVAAFNTLPISRHTEQFIVAALRTAGALTVSLVAELDGRVVGHVAFSPVTVSDGTSDWYGGGPLSVLPELHRQGIGQTLVRRGLAELERLHARGCCLVGDPSYYVRFGFKNIPGLIHEGIPQEYFLALPFDGYTPQGTVAFHEAFHATS